MANQPQVVTTSPSSNLFIRTPPSGNSTGKEHISVFFYYTLSKKLEDFISFLLNWFIVSTTPHGSNTRGTLNRSRTTANALARSCDQVTQVAATPIQQTPLSGISNGNFLDVKYS